MRLMPSRYIQTAPAQAKKNVAQIAHLSPPLKGLNHATKTNVGDPLTAMILSNFVVEDDRISKRGGFRKTATIDTLVVAVSSLSKGNPAVCTVAAGDIAKFYNGQVITIRGADASHVAANGKHTITSVGVPANTFQLVGVDTTAAAGAQTISVEALAPPIPVLLGGTVKDPINHLVPWHGPAPKLAAATSTKIYDSETGVLIKSGFAKGDWHWTAFSNLSHQDYTVMVNGADGVWSWDGSVGATVDYPAVTVTKLENTSPARVTVAAADITKFYNGQIVFVTGASTGLLPANGYHVIDQVGVVANTFNLVGVDCTAGTTINAPTGITVDPPGTGIIKENVTAPVTESWISVSTFQLVVAHMNRLFFADGSNLAVYYLPLQSKTGEVKVLPLNAYFKRGGYIKAMYTWTLDGGGGLDDQLVIFTSNGECLIFGGTDPASNFSIKGIYRFDSPMSKHSTVAYGGELYVLISTGLVPMSTLMKAETEQLGQVDQSVLSIFMERSTQFGDKVGWQAILNPQAGRVFCNIPRGGTNQYMQMTRHMPKPVWSMYEDIPSRCWGWLYPYMWFGDDLGNIYQGHTEFLNDDGKPIIVDVQMAWSQYRTPGVKHFKMIKVYYTSDGEVQPALDIKCDYDLTPPENIPDVTFRQGGVEWGKGTWGVDFWASGPIPTSSWNGVGRLGRVGAPRLRASIGDCEFSITGFDLIYETGAALG
jgi:hypothetical protein